MTDYLQRLVRRSQEIPGRTLTAPPATLFRVASRSDGDIDDPFAGTVDATGDAGASAAAARPVGAAPPLSGPAAHAPHHAAEERWDLPPRRMVDALPSVPAPDEALRLTPGAPVQAAPPDKGQNVQPQAAHVTLAHTSSHQAPPADEPTVTIVRQKEPALMSPGAGPVPDRAAAPAPPPAPRTPPTDRPDELQTLMRRLQAALAPAAEAAPRGDEPQVQHAAQEQAPRQMLAPAPALPAAPVERRQLSIGRLVVEVTPPALPPPAAKVRTVVRPSAPPRSPAAVSSKLRFGIGQL